MLSCPVIFRCSECTMELPNLEHLESHIWSRHLHNFPFNCAICRFPAIAHTSLAAHFKQAHSSDQPVEFQRKMLDEVRLRNIVASSIVVPVYEEVPFRHPSQVTSLREDQRLQLDMKPLDSQTTDSLSNVVEENEPIDVVNITGDCDSLNMVNEPSSSEGVPFLREHMSIENEIINDTEMFVPEDINYRKVGVFRSINDGPDVAIVDESVVPVDQHMTGGTQMVHMDDDDTSYFYEGYEEGDVLVDRSSCEFQDTEGNSVYVEESLPSTFKSNVDTRLRLAKQRHIDYIVNKVARRNNGRSRRPLTIYECEECGKIIRYPSKIKEHRRSHSGVKPHECPHCGQRFSQKGGLTCHLRLHTGERPYTCTWDCGKSFHSNSALKMHERSHNGERPYSCEICGKLFSKRSHCQRHESSIHPRETARRVAHQFGLAAAGEDEDRLREVVNGVIEEVRIERSLRKELKIELN